MPIFNDSENVYEQGPAATAPMSSDAAPLQIVPPCSDDTRRVQLGFSTTTHESAMPRGLWGRYAPVLEGGRVRAFSSRLSLAFKQRDEARAIDEDQRRQCVPTGGHTPA